MYNICKHIVYFIWALLCSLNLEYGVPRLQPKCAHLTLENLQNLGAAQPKDCGAPRVGAALNRAWSTLHILYSELLCNELIYS